MNKEIDSSNNRPLPSVCSTLLREKAKTQYLLYYKNIHMQCGVITIIIA